MHNVKAYMLLGFDRVGKGTIIENTVATLPPFSYETYHFTAPEDKDKPMKQYYDFLNGSFSPYTDYVFIDRGFPETLFFEKSRCGNIINIDYGYKLFNEFSSQFIEFNLIIVQRYWEDIEQAHLEEIKNGINHDSSAEFPDLARRKKEYIQYYEFMRIFWSTDYADNIKWVINQPIDYKLCLQS